MRTVIYIILPIIYLMYPAYGKTQQNNRTNNKSTPVFAVDSVFSDGNGASCFHCNNFVANAFTSSFKLKTLLKNKNNFFNISKQAVPNMHDSTIVDTAYNFSNRKNEISIYKASHAEMINRIDISDRRFYLQGQINIGMTKGNFKSKFSVNAIEGDTVVVTDDDNIVGFTFYFKKNLLVRITYKAMID
jgi:hypothetical protein